MSYLKAGEGAAGGRRWHLEILALWEHDKRPRSWTHQVWCLVQVVLSAGLFVLQFHRRSALQSEHSSDPPAVRGGGQGQGTSGIHLGSGVGWAGSRSSCALFMLFFFKVFSLPDSCNSSATRDEEQSVWDFSGVSLQSWVQRYGWAVLPWMWCGKPKGVVSPGHDPWPAWS